MLSAAFLLAIGTFASTGHKVKQDGAKAKPATSTQAPAKTDNKSEAKKDAKAAKKGKKADAKKAPATNPK